MYCKYCEKDKPEDQFRKHSRKCKPCQAKATAMWREKNPEKARIQISQWRADNKQWMQEYNRQRYRSPDFKRSPNAGLFAKRWRDANREKRNASAKVYYALKTGKLTKPKDCSICGDDYYIIAHHEDYSKPLEVKWVCQSCHRKIHLAIPSECPVPLPA